MPIYPLQRVFYPQNRLCTPKIVGTFYMQGYKDKEKTAIAPPVSKLSGHPAAVVPHIDSRVKIIDNERPGASPCDDDYINQPER